jgi:TolB-like protein/DNA-binding winged helix-turn-helix (wHTH) protein
MPPKRKGVLPQVVENPRDPVRLGDAVLEPARVLLRAPDGAETTLRPKTFELLALLLARPGELVTRSQILDALWPDLFVSDDSITQCVGELRRALGAEAARLKTLPKRGYLLEVVPAPVEAPKAAPGLPATPIGGGAPVVAVLPFHVATLEPALAAFGDAVLEGVVGALVRMREPVVISANSTRRLATEPLDLAETGRRLGARYIASGRLRRAENLFRLTVELAQADTGTVLWHRGYDVTETGSFAAEDEIAGVIAHTLVPHVQAAELAAARRRAPGELAAYHLLLQARALIYRMERDAFEKAAPLLRQAVALDGGFAAAHAALADWHSLRLGQGWSPDREADTQGLIAAARQALALDPGHARALAMLGHNRTIFEHRHEEATRLFDRALDAAPNDSEAWMWSAPTFAYLGEGREAVRRAERAIQLSPMDPLLFRYEHFVSIAHYATGDMERAAEHGLRSAAANPSYTSNLRTTAAALAGLGRLEPARELARRVMEIEPEFRVGQMITRYASRDPAVRRRFAEQMIAAGLPQ